MTWIGVAQILIFFGIVLVITKPVGTFMYRVFDGERTFLHPIFGPLERLIYRLSGIHDDVEQSWIGYSASMISFSIFSFLAVYLLQRLQGHLPLNPMHFSTPQAPQAATPMTPYLAFNTTVSFMSNTNSQAHSTTQPIAHLPQILNTTIHAFTSRSCRIA